MPRSDLAHPDDAPGDWFVDTRCIRCDAARHWAPGLIGTDAGGCSFVARQPVTADDTAAMWRAAEACPTRSIGSRRPAAGRPPRAPDGVFPHPLAPGVLALGSNAMASFGAHSWLVIRPDGGNLMVDSPRYNRPLAAAADALGGVAHILLTHRDDVADADRWAQRYQARVWIGAADADAAPCATDLIEPGGTTLIAPGALAIPAPGHTEGHMVYHIDHRHLFTGDTLHWNHRRGEPDVFPAQTFHSWAVLADTMDLLAGLPVRWLLPGHGMWRQFGAGEWRRQMAGLGPAMRATGQDGWARRADAAYYWY